MHKMFCHYNFTNEKRILKNSALKFPWQHFLGFPVHSTRVIIFHGLGDHGLYPQHFKSNWV